MLKKKITLFFIIIILWIIADQVSKMFFASMTPGTSAGMILGGLIDLRVVHNTGAAWGIFSDNTFALGLFSTVLSLIITAGTLYFARRLSYATLIGLALIVAGGIGNALDRFIRGYVIDFFAATFVDFPVFNVADIGVTSGVAIVVISLLVSTNDKKQASS